MPRKMTIEERFDKYVSVNEDTGCWIWTGARNCNGYGALSIRVGGVRTSPSAHRASYTLYVGEIPKGLQVLHKCDTPLCVNPEHLWLGTQLDNVRDCIAKGRARYNPQPSILPPVLRRADNPNAKLTEDDVAAIRAAALEGESNSSMARKFNISDTHVARIVARKSWP